ncbi:sigma-70 family RNA polymerase sigma factor [Egibacter rhizosphaerae]|uniref:Sigma-70 family RNA polymerase sigma factor n=1 Tax=Egibacter rhizosphaerae TaxID=1670831 RepID=A0A411YFN9_9ACTN|nr:sigma-70 family RNA polymerase sigma factor [Egibacter rhizosphaerae]QBI20065.1 sigma-70 family RNA polymerase sigma factor [Egibacter rhizosphaerae]
MTWDVAGLTDALARGDEGAARRRLAGLRGDSGQWDDAMEQLATRAADDAVALELLVEAIDESGLARRAVARVLVDEAAVEDVAQDVLVGVATSVGSFRGEARFSTWLHALARNRAVDHLRRQRATSPLEAEDVGDAERMSSLIAGRETARQLLSRLPEHYREPVRLRDVERLPYGEIADRLDRNENTVKAHVARGRALLATMLEPFPGEGAR